MNMDTNITETPVTETETTPVVNTGRKDSGPTYDLPVRYDSWAVPGQPVKVSAGESFIS